MEQESLTGIMVNLFFPYSWHGKIQYMYLFYLVSPLASAHGKNRYFMLIKNAYLTGDIVKLYTLSIQLTMNLKFI